MTYAGGQVTSEYRLSLARLDDDIAAIERRLKKIKPPALPAPRTAGGGAKAAIDETKANAQLARQQALLAQAQARRAAADIQAATAGQRLATVQNQTAASAQRVAVAEQQAAAAMQRTAREAAMATAAQARAEQQVLRLAQARQRATQQEQQSVTQTRSWAQAVQQSAGRVDELVGTVGRLGGAFAVVGAGQALYNFARVGASADAARASFDKLASSAGTSGAALLRSLQEASAGTVATTDIIKSSNTALLLLGSDVATKLPQLLQIAKASATTLGTDVGQVFDSLVTGISRGSTELIDNAGITVKAEEAYRAYAAQIGKSADALSSAEKQQAILNAVLTAGQTIVDQTSGGAETAAQSFQRFEASMANAGTAAATFAGNVVAPLVGGLAEIGTYIADGINQLNNYGATLERVGNDILASSPNYDAYLQKVNELNSQLPLGVPKLQAVSEEAFNLSQTLQQAGAETAVVTSTVTNLAPVMDLLASALGQASKEGPAVASALAEIEPAALAAAAASEENAIAVQNALQAYLDGVIGPQQLAAEIDKVTAAGLQAALTEQRRGEATAFAGTADQQAAEAAAAAAEASNAAAIARLQQAAESELAAQREAELERAILAAAAAGGSAEAAAARIASQFNGVEAPAVLNLINLHRQLAAVRGGPTAKGYGGMAPGDVARSMQVAKQTQYQVQLQNRLTEATGSTAQQLALVNRQLAQAPRYSQQAMDLEVRKAQLLAQQAREAEKAAGKAAGGGSAKKSPAVKAAEQQAKDLARIDEQRIELARTTAKRLEELARDSADRQIKIQEEYARRQLAAEQKLRVGSLNSRADFYDALTQATPDIGQAQAEQLAAQYEAAFAEAQKLAQEGKAQLASEYLSLRQQQIAAEAEFQKRIAELRKQAEEADTEAERKKAQAEIDRLTRIEELRRQARDEELKQLLEGGDDNVTARDEALTEEQRRYAEQQASIMEASDEKALKLTENEQKVLDKTKEANLALAEQLRLQQQIAGKAPAAAPSLPQAQAAAASAAAPAPAPAAALPTAPGGATVVDAPVLTAQVANLEATIARIASEQAAQSGQLADLLTAARDTAKNTRAGSRGST